MSGPIVYDLLIDKEEQWTNVCARPLYSFTCHAPPCMYKPHVILLFMYTDEDRTPTFYLYYCYPLPTRSVCEDTLVIPSTCIRGRDIVITPLVRVSVCVSVCLQLIVS